MSQAEIVPVVNAPMAQSFARRNFGGIDLGHKARNRAALKTAERICRHPGGTLPTKMASPAAYKSMDLLMNRPETTHARMLAPHYALTKEKIAAAAARGPVLLLHDTTELDYSGLSISDLGPIGNGCGRGYLCHNSLAVVPGGRKGSREVLGLAHQILHSREAVGKKEGVKAKRERPGRESRLWSRAVEALGPGMASDKVIDVADAGADLFEFLATEQKLNRRCLVRACKDRSIVVGHETIEPGRGKNKWVGKASLYKHLRSLGSMGGQKTKEVRGKGAAESRTATLSVSYAAVQLLPPHVRRGEYEEKPLAVWVLRVWEENPPAGEEALEWFLTTFEPVTAANHAWEVSSWYGCRYVVEEYHKGLKTGCSIEDMQFETSQPLKPMIALLSVVAVMLLNLREAARRPDADERPATEVVDETYEEVLRGWRYEKNPPAKPFTIREFYLALARLGGHMNRKSDGFPGWLTLWRGWMELHAMVAGAEALRRIRKIVG